MKGTNPYDILGVPLSATAAEIKGAYRRLARRHHPDANPTDPAATERFQQIAAAYEILSNPRRRARYDHEFFSARTSGPQTPPRPSWSAPRSPRAKRQAPPRRRPGLRGRDVHVTASVSLEDVLGGTERTLHVQRADPCRACAGAGVPGTEPWIPCVVCRGTGRTESREGLFASATVCEACHGQGERAIRPCRACHGDSIVPATARLRLAIPSGVNTGTVIRFAGQGEAGKFNGARGDLLLTIDVEPHRLFDRAGADLACTVGLTPAQAVLGAAVSVDLLDGGRTTLKVRPGTQPDTIVRLPGRGVPVRPQGAARGDLRVRFTVVVPARPTPAERRLYEQLAAINETAGSAVGNLRDRIRARFRRLRS